MYRQCTLYIQLPLILMTKLLPGGNHGGYGEVEGGGTENKEKYWEKGIRGDREDIEYM